MKDRYRKPCLNDARYTYDPYSQTDQSPLSIGLTAEGYNEGLIVTGRDNKRYIVVKNGKGYKCWSNYYNKVKKVNII